MNIASLFETLLTFIWPLALAYVAYVHKELNAVEDRIDQLKEDHYKHVAQVNKDFATREVVAELENKLTTVLNRIDDKVTRILQERK